MVASRNTIHDFIDRTVRNLDKVDKAVEENENAFFEVTHLINSTIGLLMFPNEEYLNKLPQIHIKDRLKSDELPKILHGKVDLGTLQETVKKIRNAVAHYNVEFVNHNNKIEGLYLWTLPDPKDKEPDLVVYISIYSLKAIFRLATREYKKLAKEMTIESSQNPKLTNIEKIIGRKLRLTNPLIYQKKQ